MNIEHDLTKTQQEIVAGLTELSMRIKRDILSHGGSLSDVMSNKYYHSYQMAINNIYNFNVNLRVLKDR